MSEAGPASKERPFLVSLFSVKGRIGPGRYWLGIVCAVVFLAVSLVLVTLASNPLGSDGGLILTVPLLGACVWVLTATFAKRLNDAGKHPTLALPAVFALLGSLFLSVALIETAPLVGLIAAAAIVVVVGHIDTIFKPASPAKE